MSNQLIKVSEAAQRLGVTTNLPSNKALTKSEFDSLLLEKSGIDPEQASNGVYIMHKSRKLIRKECWFFPNDEASGEAVKTDNCAFVIAKEEQTSIEWGGYGTLINGCTTTTDESTAKKDYSGKQNTDAIVSQLGTSDTYAARYCKEYTFPHGVQGYLPALGELYEAYQNKSEVDVCMSLIGGEPLYDLGIDNYLKWSSTQFSAHNAWYFHFYDDNLYYSNNKDDSSSTNCARPFAAFQ
jgi:hypothetical protein